MPSLSDAENAIVELIAAAVYPNGIAQASAVTVPVRIYRGWPNPAALEADLALGTVNVSVFPVSGATTVTTRYAPDWIPAPVAPTLYAAVAGNTVTFSGTADTGQLAGILVDGVPFVYRTVPGDTTISVAANLCTAIAATRTATVNASTITIATSMQLIARAVADATGSLELRRQRQDFRVSLWCPTPDARDITCTLVDEALAAAPFLTLAGGCAARLTYNSTAVLDTREDAMLYRRDLLYSVEFPTIQAAIQSSMLFGTLQAGATLITA